MNANDLQAKQEILKDKKRKLLQIHISGGATLAVVTIFCLWLILNCSPWIGLLSFALAGWIDRRFGWQSKNYLPIVMNIRSLEQEIKEETSARWVEDVTARIQSGQIQPNPNFKDIL